MAKIERIHSLDALRASMMFLGILLHAAMSYTIVDFGEAWPFKDPNTTSLSMDMLYNYIHSFRMPIFFMVSGFFAALLYYERSPTAMLNNRIRRVLLPFLVFLFLLWPVMGASFLFLIKTFTGTIPAEATAAVSISAFIPTTTFHLWFLYYLLMLTAAVFVIAKVIPADSSFTQSITKKFNKILASTFRRTIAMVLAVFTSLLIMGQEWVGTSPYWIPEWRTLLFYGLFYLFGWGLFNSKQYLDSFKQSAGALAMAGLVVFVIKEMLPNWYEPTIWMNSLFNAVSVSLSLFGITGLFLKYCSAPSARLRYLSDASYWVYLMHLLFITLLAGVIVDVPVPAEIKFVITVVITTVITVVSYHYLVRHTVIGQFLNGRKYAKQSLKQALL